MQNIPHEIYMNIVFCLDLDVTIIAYGWHESGV